MSLTNEEINTVNTFMKLLKGSLEPKEVVKDVEEALVIYNILEELRQELGMDYAGDVISVIYERVAPSWIAGEFAGTRLSGILENIEKTHPFAQMRGMQLREDYAYTQIPQELHDAGKLLMELVGSALADNEVAKRCYKRLLEAHPNDLQDVAREVTKGIHPRHDAIKLAAKILESPSPTWEGTLSQHLDPLIKEYDVLFEALSYQD